MITETQNTAEKDRRVSQLLDDIIGIFLQVTRGLLRRKGAPELADQTLEAVLRALGASPARKRRKV